MPVPARLAVALGLLAVASPARQVPGGPGIARSVERIVANANRVPAGRLRQGILTLHLELRTGTFRPHADDGPGVEVQAFGEAGRPLQIPGPLIRVPEGTVIEATIRNRLRDSTLVLHGFATRTAPGDGHGDADDSLRVPPGATRRLRFEAGRAGTYYYWGSTTGKGMNDDRWIDSQLSGGFIVDPAGTTPPPDERIFLMGLWLKPADTAAHDPGGEFMVINGKSWPETERLQYTAGDQVHWRWLNATSSSHPMHLHGFFFDVESRGSWAADTVYSPAERRLAVTELMLPGGTMAMRWSPARPGNWLFHCHFAFHISDEQTLSAPPDPADAAGGQPHHHMAGLVLGIHVAPRGPSVSLAAAAEPVEPSRLRLLVQPARAPADSAHIMGYALQEGSLEPVGDSVPIPGSTLVLERGRPVRITVVNRLAEPTAVHWHGIELESYPDGVPDWSGTDDRRLRAIAPGDSFTAEFTPPRLGNVHLPLPRERAGPDPGRSVRAADRGRARHHLRHREQPAGGGGRPLPQRQLVRPRERTAGAGADRDPGGPELPLPADQYRRRAGVARPPAPATRFVAGGVARGGEGRRRPAAIAGCGRGETAHRAGGDGGFRGPGGCAGRAQAGGGFAVCALASRGAGAGALTRRDPPRRGHASVHDPFASLRVTRAPPHRRPQDVSSPGLFVRFVCPVPSAFMM